MSPENVELVRRSFEAYANGGFGRIKGSTRTIRQPVAIVIDEVRDGKIAAIRSYFSSAGA